MSDVNINAEDVLCPEACCLNSESMLFSAQVMELYS